MSSIFLTRRNSLRVEDALVKQKGTAIHEWSILLRTSLMTRQNEAGN